MTDYLEEHLERAEDLLEQVRQLDRSASELSRRTVQETKNTDEAGDFEKKDESLGENVPIESKKQETVDNLEEKVDQLEKRVDNAENDAEIPEEGPEKGVNWLEKAVDESQYAQRRPDAEEKESGSAVRFPKKATNAEKAENDPPLAVQLKELDRAVSVLTGDAPAGQRADQGRQSADSWHSLRRPAAYPDMAETVGEGWGMESALERSRPDAGGGLRWAEQADRVFRRDSRRYDGGFSLY